MHKVSLLKDLTQRAADGGAATPEDAGGDDDDTATPTVAASARAAGGLRSKPAAPRRRTRSTKASSAGDGGGGAKERCQGALPGDWCGPYLTQDPIPAVPPPAFNNTCLWGCNFVGVCDAQAGWCRCPAGALPLQVSLPCPALPCPACCRGHNGTPPARNLTRCRSPAGALCLPPPPAAGWTGDDCSTVMKRHCSQRNREHGFEQWDKPPNYAAGGLILRCAGTCDTDIGMCFCPEEDDYGRLAADPKLRPGARMCPPAWRRWLAGLLAGRLAGRPGGRQGLQRQGSRGSSLRQPGSRGGALERRGGEPEAALVPLLPCSCPLLQARRRGASAAP